MELRHPRSSVRSAAELKREPGAAQRGAAVLFLIAWGLRLHRWVPAFLIVAFVSWLILHNRLEAGLGHALARQWRRAWPPRPLVLVALLCASMVAFVLADVPTTAKVMPVAIDILALSMLLAGALFPLPSWLGGDGPSPLRAQSASERLVSAFFVVAVIAFGVPATVHAERARVLSGWTLWRDIGIYRAAGHALLGGPTYAVIAYETETDCHAGQRQAMANEELPRRGPLTERISDGIMVWDPNRQHYTTFRYRCAPTGAHLRPNPMSR